MTLTARPGHAPQQGVQTRGELAQVERFEQVIIGPRLKPLDTISDGVAGRQHQHRQQFALLT